MTDREQRIANLEAVHAIKNLKARYCEICDFENMPEVMPTIFTEDGVFEQEGEGGGRWEGADGIREFFTGAESRVQFAVHMALNPIIEVNGDTATGRWNFWGLFTFRDGRRTWMANRYWETYEKTDDGWKIKHLRTIQPPIVNATFEEGW